MRDGHDPLQQSVSPAHFAEHLAVLEREANIVRLRDVTRRGGERQVAITFDDGYADNAQRAAPALHSAGLPATFFVVGRLTADGTEFWWDRLEHLLFQSNSAAEYVAIRLDGQPIRIDIRSEAGRQRALKALNRRLRAGPAEHADRVVGEIAEAMGVAAPVLCADHALLDAGALHDLAADPLFEIGSHAWSHSMLSALDPDQQTEELKRSRTTIEACTRKPVTSLAYPYGTPDSLGPTTLRSVRASGYERACVNTLDRFSGHRMLTLPRRMDYDWSGEEFARRLQSWWGVGG